MSRMCNRLVKTITFPTDIREVELVDVLPSFAPFDFYVNGIEN